MTWTRATAVFVLFAGWVCFARLGATPAIHNEGVLAHGAREMARTGDYLVPRLYGEVYTYKPPLAYWLVDASFRLTGSEGVAALRLPMAASAFLMAAAIFALIGTATTPRIGLVTALASLTGGLLLEKIRTAEYDAVLTAAVGIAVVAAAVNLSRERTRPALWGLAWASLSVAFLAKGVPAIMSFVPGLLVAAFVVGRPRRLLAPASLGGAAIFAAMVALYLAATAEAVGTGGFAQPLLEARIRGLAWNLPAFGVTLAKPLVAWAGFLPWTILLPTAGLGLRRARSTRPEARTTAQRLALCGAAFMLGTLAAFMAVPTHETRYLMPLAAPVALLFGMTATGALTVPDANALRGRHLALGMAWFTAVLATAAGLYRMPAGTAIVLAVVGVAAGSALWRVPAIRTDPAKALLVASFCLAAIVVLAVLPRRAERLSLRPIAEELAPHLPPDVGLWIPGPAGPAKQSSLVYYLDRPARTFGAAGPPRPPLGAIGLFASRDLVDGRPPEIDAATRWVKLATGRHRHYEYSLWRLERSDGA